MLKIEFRSRGATRGCFLSFFFPFFFSLFCVAHWRAIDETSCYFCDLLACRDPRYRLRRRLEGAPLSFPRILRAPPRGCYTHVRELRAYPSRGSMKGRTGYIYDR